MIRKALFWNFAGQFASFGIMFIGSVVIARLLSPREMGIYAVSMATIGVLQIIASFGVGTYVIRATELDAHTLDTAFTINAVLNVSLAVAVFLLSFAGAHFLAEPAVATVMRLLALSPIIAIFDFRSATMLQREMQFKRLSIVTTTQAVVSMGVTIGAALAGASYLSPAFGGLASAVVGTVGNTLMGRQHFALRFSRTGWKPMASFGVKMMSIGGLSMMAARVGDIILGHFLGLSALGLFNRANNLAMLIFQNIYGTATRVIFARMSEIYRETRELKQPYLQGLRFITAILGPMQIGLAVLAQPVIQLLYGEKWTGAALPLSLLMVAQFVSMRYAMNWELFVIRDELNVQTRIEVFKSIFSLITRTIGSLISITAAAAATLIDAIFSIVLYQKQVYRLAHIDGSELGAVTNEALLLTGVAAAPAFVLMLSTGWDPLTPLPLVASSVVLGAALWVLTLAHRGHPVFHEMQRFARIAAQRIAARPA